MFDKFGGIMNLVRTLVKYSPMLIAILESLTELNKKIADLLDDGKINGSK